MANKDPQPSADEKAQYDKTKDELVRMLAKKRAADRQLVGRPSSRAFCHSHWGMTGPDGVVHLQPRDHIPDGHGQHRKHHPRLRRIPQTYTGRRGTEETRDWRGRQMVLEQQRDVGKGSSTYAPLLYPVYLGGTMQSLELIGDGEETTPAPDEFKPGVTTVVVPPAPRAQELTAAQQKKHRDREYQRRKRAMRRSAGTMSDDDAQSTGTARRAHKRARLADDE